MRLSTRLLLALVLAALSSCTADRAEQRDEQRTREEEWRFDLPIPVPAATGWQIVPFPVTVHRTVTETRSGVVKATTTFRAPELTGALVAALRQALPGLGAVGAIMSPGPAPTGGGVPDGAIWGGSGLAATGAAWLAAKLKRDRDDREWEREMAEKVKLADAAGYQRGRADGIAEMARAPGARLPHPRPDGAPT